MTDSTRKKMEKSKSEKKEQNEISPLDLINTISDLIDRLSIENIRLWHLKDDVMVLKQELEQKNLPKKRRDEILEILAQKSFTDIDIVRKRSALKKAIDKTLIQVITNVIKGNDIAITDEHKQYGK